MRIHLLPSMRYVGSTLVLIGYYFLLYVDVNTGVLIRLFANLLSLPWAIKNKLWDFVALLVFFIVLESHKLQQVLP